jgi:hypothetical protein
MRAKCRCGSEIRFSFEQLGCVECGAPCCPGCSYQLESASYCPACAEAILELPWAARPPLGSMSTTI